MKITRWKLISLLVAMVATLTVAGCGSDEGDSTTGSEDTNYSEAVDYTITGIEPGAGTSKNTELALEEYDSLEGWEANFSSTGAMLSALDQAIENKEPIIITGWTPHWMFAKHPDMKFLDDPKEVYGGSEDIRTGTRKGLKEDMPNAYKLLDQFKLEIEDMENMMNQINDAEPSEVAAQWIEDNPDKVAEWTKGVQEVDGRSIEIVAIPWDSDRIATAVMTEVLKNKGYEVESTPVDVAVMFETLANGEADATFGLWMPVTHASFYEKHKDHIDDLGPFLEGARIGMVVPSYMDIDSIEDLQPKE
ncbi:glycine/betaine ABC transporter [Filobacillus milosensis]|uniref:Glycine/betaine ABC transporter n=1 Tax=Filobacillus milosensis TaxID=94137 RepID=A0A4Y8IHD7_9BACI|nr:glycine betaine ABC transporter substrate-binding protein [Filobacillus milosensis]TFB18483.1 glycine/betaine ABC transporter [Filobacillus milosensis]